MSLTSQALNSELLRILREEILLAKRSLRSIEKELGLTHGMVGNILEGRTELRLRHVEQIGRLFGLTLDQILLAAVGGLPLPLRISSRLPPDERFAELIAEKVAQKLLQQPPLPAQPRRPTRSDSSLLLDVEISPLVPAAQEDSDD